jgi:hypothetical protein
VASVTVADPSLVNRWSPLVPLTHGSGPEAVTSATVPLLAALATTDPYRRAESIQFLQFTLRVT